MGKQIQSELRQSRDDFQRKSQAQLAHSLEMLTQTTWNAIQQIEQPNEGPELIVIDSVASRSRQVKEVGTKRLLLAVSRQKRYLVKVILLALVGGHLSPWFALVICAVAFDRLYREFTQQGSSS